MTSVTAGRAWLEAADFDADYGLDDDQEPFF